MLERDNLPKNGTEIEISNSGVTLPEKQVKNNEEIRPPYVTIEAISENQIRISFPDQKAENQALNYFKQYFDIINRGQSKRTSHFNSMQDPNLIDEFKYCQMSVVQKGIYLVVSFENKENKNLPEQSVFIRFLEQMLAIRKKRGALKDRDLTYEITSTNHPVLIEVKTPEKEDVTFLYGKFRFTKHVVWKKIFSRKLKRGVSKLELEENVLKFIEQYNDALNKMNYTIKDVVNALVLRFFSNVAEFPSEMDERLVDFAERVLKRFAEPENGKRDELSANKLEEKKQREEFNRRNANNFYAWKGKKISYTIAFKESLEGLYVAEITIPSKSDRQFMPSKFRSIVWKNIFERSSCKGIHKLYLKPDAMKYIEQYDELLKQNGYTTIQNVVDTLILKLLSNHQKGFPPDINACLANIAAKTIGHFSEREKQSRTQLENRVAPPQAQELVPPQPLSNSQFQQMIQGMRSPPPVQSEKAFQDMQFSPDEFLAIFKDDMPSNATQGKSIAPSIPSSSSQTATVPNGSGFIYPDPIARRASNLFQAAGQTNGTSSQRLDSKDEPRNIITID